MPAHPMAIGDFMGDLPTWLAVVVAALGGGVAYLEYRRANRWKRSEFVAAQMEKFFSDPKIAMALTLVDYSRIKLRPDGAPAGRGKQGILFTDEVLCEALRDHREFANETECFSDDQTLARAAFDALLSGLDTFDHFIETKLVTVNDLRPYLSYWINVLANPATEWKDPRFYQRLQDFICAYGYTGVAKLFARFGNKKPSESTSHRELVARAKERRSEHAAPPAQR